VLCRGIPRRCHFLDILFLYSVYGQCFSEHNYPPRSPVVRKGDRRQRPNKAPSLVLLGPCQAQYGINASSLF
jgi:hypothetical protein